MKAKALDEVPHKGSLLTIKVKFLCGHELYCAVVFGAGVVLVWGGLAAVTLWAVMLARG